MVTLEEYTTMHFRARRLALLERDDLDEGKRLRLTREAALEYGQRAYDQLYEEFKHDASRDTG